MLAGCITALEAMCYTPECKRGWLPVLFRGLSQGKCTYPFFDLSIAYRQLILTKSATRTQVPPDLDVSRHRGIHTVRKSNERAMFFPGPHSSTPGTAPPITGILR